MSGGQTRATEAVSGTLVSLTGRAVYYNTRGESVPFGGDARASVSGDLTSAAESALAKTFIPSARQLFWNQFISREVDPILDKISAHGIQSLTPRERQILEAARAKMERR